METDGSGERHGMGALRHRTIATNGVTLHAVEAGDERGPLVVLLHGFPEFWYGWRKQIEDLAAAGYWVVAPDQRGYNLSSKPRGIAAYAIEELAADLVGLLDARGRRTAAVVGHDWGAVVAWWAALRHPDRLNRLVILNGPHPAAMDRGLRKSFTQLLKSWYVFFFQLPWLPEAMARWGNGQVLARGMRKTSRPGTFSAADIEEYRRAWSQPGALKAMIHWYRAALRARPALRDGLRVRVPTLIVWGAKDRFLNRELAQFSVGLCDAGRLEVIEDATHWVQHEQAQRVNKMLADFLGAGA